MVGMVIGTLLGILFQTVLKKYLNINSIAKGTRNLSSDEAHAGSHSKESDQKNK